MALRKSNVKIEWNSDFAYVIGIITSDGNLSPDLRHICIVSKDRELLVKIKRALVLKNKIGTTFSGGKKSCYRIQFGDKNFFEFLLTIGLAPKKSKTIHKVIIPKDFFIDFFRGCFDGDGSIRTFKHPESITPQVRLSIASGSKLFSSWLLEEVRNFFKIKTGFINYDTSSDVYQLTFASQDSRIILKSMYYSDQVLHLSRKKKRAQSILRGEW